MAEEKWDKEAWSDTVKTPRAYIVPDEPVILKLNGMTLRLDSKLAAGTFYDVPTQFETAQKIDPVLTLAEFAKRCGRATELQVIEILLKNEITEV